MKRQRYAPMGLLAVGPKAFGVVFDVPDDPSVESRGDVAIVSVRGPLMHHHEWCFDSYDDIRERLASALARNPRVVVLSLDTPGGLVSGCFETAAELRRMAAAANIPLHAYVDGQATSAGYALACAAESITVPATGIVGSIGVIDTLIDATAQDAMWGVSFKLVASGARKTDGNIHSAISEDALFATQQRVNDLAEIFFAHVNAMRPGLGIDQIRALEAGLSHGDAAVELRLADRVGTLDDLLSMIASGELATNEGTSTMSAYDDAVAALRKAAEGDDEEAENAKRMLAALEEDEKPEDDSAAGDDEKPEEDQASSDDEDEEKPAENAKAIAALARSGKVQDALVALANLAQKSSDESRTTKKKLEAAERSALRNSRPDVAKGIHDAFGALSLADYRAALSKIEKPKRPAPAGTVTPGATRGATQGPKTDGKHVDAVDDRTAADMDRVFGLSESKDLGVVAEGNRLIFGATGSGKER